ncbi:hypothetical protein [Rhizobium sp. CC-YZS058]|uniref:hypothetical protein n=1 Tax=Rhizobium sp. CC-YZS058 TaxID=3042153 RepID=UPI002B05AF31|nr:hypothetical protein [Rhizobium sp. CC-YZS058]MEA3533730.1 hypothetical protein [Rhizobium sp. CC-YZS058]
MTLVFPLAPNVLNDKLPIAAVVWDQKRMDRISGQASGRFWGAELAPPLWRPTIELATRPSSEMKRYAALIRALHGVQNGFFLTDPLSPFPAADPGGQILGNSQVQIESIPSHRSSQSFKGLPPFYQLSIADKFTVVYGSNPTRYGFFEITEDAAATSDGTTGLIGVYPHLPAGVAENAVVILAKPFGLFVVEPGSHNPGRARRHLTEGAGFTAIQKLFA